MWHCVTKCNSIPPPTPTGVQGCYTKGMKNETTTQPMYNPTTVAGLYTCLEMLVKEREDLHAWWCNLLYLETGDINTLAWNDRTLGILENDVAYYA